MYYAIVATVAFVLGAILSHHITTYAKDAEAAVTGVYEHIASVTREIYARLDALEAKVAAEAKKVV